MTSHQSSEDESRLDASRDGDDATIRSLIRGCMWGAGMIAIGLLVLVIVVIGLLVGLCGFGR